MKDRYTPEQQAEKRQEILNRLQAGVEAIQTSEQFAAFLSFQAKFHSYSAGNALLIMLQRPDASYVAGYQAWKTRFDRQVKKGEKGITIIVPHVRKVDDEEADEKRRVISSFGTGTVFAYEQTEGKPLPEIAVPTLEGEQGKGLYDDLVRVLRDDRVRVRTEPQDSRTADLKGYYTPRTREIVVREGSQLQMTKTLTHEAGHHVHIAHVGAESEDRAEKETVAEASAFVVLSHFGLDSSERSFPYVGVWAKTPDVFRAQLSNIQKVSSHIVEAVEKGGDTHGNR
jgi:antirestriction protein ArdC